LWEIARFFRDGKGKPQQLLFKCFKEVLLTPAIYNGSIEKIPKVFLYRSQLKARSLGQTDYQDISSISCLGFVGRCRLLKIKKLPLWELDTIIG
jgi:hypothetical protein